MLAHEKISAAIRKVNEAGKTAIVPYVTAGFPNKEKFASTLQTIAAVSDVVEIGVPFTDPMADGTTIQRSSRVALAQGVTLPWIFDCLASLNPRPQAPLILMSYLNPLLAFGLEKLAQQSVLAGVSGFIVPDLPFEESADLREALDEVGIALVQMVTPVTPDERLAMLCKGSRGFVYAVTMTGTTGKNVAVLDDVLAYMDRVRKVSPVPVCAGFGIRERQQVAKIGAHVDGVVIGAAFIEVLERSEDPAKFLTGLRG